MKVGFIFDIQRRGRTRFMGRPPLNLKETKVRLPQATKERIKALVGNYGIATFIRQAVENELARREGDLPTADDAGIRLKKPAS